MLSLPVVQLFMTTANYMQHNPPLSAEYTTIIPDFCLPHLGRSQTTGWMTCIFIMLSAPAFIPGFLFTYRALSLHEGYSYFDIPHCAWLIRGPTFPCCVYSLLTWCPKSTALFESPQLGQKMNTGCKIYLITGYIPTSLNLIQLGSWITVCPDEQRMGPDLYWLYLQRSTCLDLLT